MRSFFSLRAAAATVNSLQQPGVFRNHQTHCLHPLQQAQFCLLMFSHCESVEFEFLQEKKKNRSRSHVENTPKILIHRKLRPWEIHMFILQAPGSLLVLLPAPAPCCWDTGEPGLCLHVQTAEKWMKNRFGPAQSRSSSYIF